MPEPERRLTISSSKISGNSKRAWETLCELLASSFLPRRSANCRMLEGLTVAGFDLVVKPIRLLRLSRLDPMKL